MLPVSGPRLWPTPLEAHPLVALEATSDALRAALATPQPGDQHHTAPSDMLRLLASWRRHLTAQRMSPVTVATYSASVTQFDAYVAAQGRRQGSRTSGAYVGAFITSLLKRLEARDRAQPLPRPLNAFFRWLVEESEITESPMLRMKPPRLPEDPSCGKTTSWRLLDACACDRTFAGCRDDAILRVPAGDRGEARRVARPLLEDIEIHHGSLQEESAVGSVHFALPVSIPPDPIVGGAMGDPDWPAGDQCLTGMI